MRLVWRALTPINVAAWSRVRRGGGRRDDLKDSGYKMPQIVIEQEAASLRRVG